MAGACGRPCCKIGSWAGLYACFRRQASKLRTADGNACQDRQMRLRRHFRLVEHLPIRCYPTPADNALTEDLVLSHSDPATGLPVGPRTVQVDGDFTPEDLLAVVLASVDDDKAEDVVQIDLRGRSDVADYMVICSGRSTRQVASISEKLGDRLKQEFRMVARMEGKETGDWVLIDTGDVIVHVFRPEVREFYDLEKMWLPGSTHRGA